MNIYVYIFQIDISFLIQIEIINERTCMLGNQNYSINESIPCDI